MTQPAYGLTFNPVNTDPRPVQPSDLSVIGIVLPSEDADPAAFPLQQVVEFNSDDADMLRKIGTGDLYRAVKRVDAQLEDFQTAARIVATRVPLGANIDETIANIVGDRALGTGLYSLLQAGPRLGVIPRLVGAPGPGYTGRPLNGINAPVLTNRGTGFTAAPTVAFTGGGGTGAAAVATISRAVASATIGVGGTGYTSATVLFAAPAAGGTRATGTATVSGGAVTAIVITDKGRGYGSSEVPSITIAGNGSGATATAVMTGIIDAVTLTNPGKGYTSAPVISFTGGSGTGATATATVDVYRNAICAALPDILEALTAHAFVGSPGTGVKADTLNWMETLASKRLIPIDAWVAEQEGTQIVYEDGVAEHLGIAARVDYRHEGLPFWSFSNQRVSGIVGLKNYYAFSLTDGANTGQELLAAHVGIIARGEIGVETAIANSGFVTAGVWNASDDPLQWFYNKSRGRDWTHLALMKSIRLRLGVENVTPHSVQAVLNDMNEVGSYLISKGAVVGFKVGFEGSRNSPSELRQGRFVVSYAQEEPAPIVGVTVDSKPFYEALEVELATLIKQADTLVPQFLS